VLEQLDPGEIEAAYASERGQPPFDPAMTTGFLLYGYCNGIYSPRRMCIVGLDPPGFSHRSRLPPAPFEGAPGLFAQLLKLCE
jgi:hypothetical protein